MQPVPRERLVAGFGALICVGMILMKFLPVVPGHFSVYEWIVLIVWSAIGLALAIREWVVNGTRDGSKKQSRTELWDVK